MPSTMKQALASVALLATGTLAQIAGEDWAHIPLGCIAADFSGLPAPATFSNNNEVVCSTHCYESGFGTAASQGTQCYCGPTDLDGEFRDNQDECDLICPGAQPDLPDEPCGGSGNNPSVYNFYGIFNLNGELPGEPEPPVVTTTAMTTSAAVTTSSDPEPTPPVETPSTSAPVTVSTAPPSTLSTSTAASTSHAGDHSMADDEGVLPGGGTQLSTATSANPSSTASAAADAAVTDQAGLTVTETATSTRTTTTCTDGLCNGGTISPTGGLGVLPAGWKIFIEITIVPQVEPCADGRLTTTLAPSAATRYYDPKLSTTTVVVEDSVTRTILVPVTRVAVVTHSPWHNGTGRTNGTQEPPVRANGAPGMLADGMLRAMVSLGFVVVGAAVMW